MAFWEARTHADGKSTQSNQERRENVDIVRVKTHSGCVSRVHAFGRCTNRGEHAASRNTSLQRICLRLGTCEEAVKLVDDFFKLGRHNAVGIVSEEILYHVGYCGSEGAHAAFVVVGNGVSLPRGQTVAFVVDVIKAVLVQN